LDHIGSEANRQAQRVPQQFRAERARPCSVFGPVLARALARFALILRALITPHFSF
jgi:hypothetical protein